MRISERLKKRIVKALNNAIRQEWADACAKHPQPMAGSFIRAHSPIKTRQSVNELLATIKL